MPKKAREAIRPFVFRPGWGHICQNCSRLGASSLTGIKVLGDLKAGQRVQAGVDSFGRPIITRYVAWTTYGPENINSSDVTTSQLRLVNFGTPGYFEIEEAATTMVEPLITSTEASGPFDAESVRRNPQPAEILKEFRPQNKTYLLAARVSGNVKSAFPDGPPKKDVKKDDDKKKGAATPKPHLKTSIKPINLILVADTDFMADLFWVQTQDLFGQQVVVPTANNADFIVNAADNLSGTSSLSKSAEPRLVGASVRTGSEHPERSGR